MPAPGLARRRSVYLGGAMRGSTCPAVFVDSSSMVPRRTAALALRCRRLAWGDMAAGLFGPGAFADRGARFMCTLRTGDRASTSAPAEHEPSFCHADRWGVTKPPCS